MKEANALQSTPLADSEIEQDPSSKKDQINPRLTSLEILIGVYLLRMDCLVADRPCLKLEDRYLRVSEMRIRSGFSVPGAFRGL